MAVKVADAPAHMGLVPVVNAIETDGVRTVFTTIAVVPAGLVQPATVALTL